MSGKDDGLDKAEFSRLGKEFNEEFKIEDYLTVQGRVVRITLTAEQCRQVSAALLRAYHTSAPKTETEVEQANFWLTGAQLFQAASIAAEQQTHLPAAMWQAWLERREGEETVS